ncbi:MAG TPA: tetratricopeptide repeat protein [Chryseosolibacter sp.]|nr:tetratricopeptide repeat protein [Chryseosolibacter sp.]
MKRMNLYLICTMLLLTMGSECLCQQALPDSIQSQFVNVPQDSNYVIRLNALATTYLKTNPAASRSVVAHVLEVAAKIKYTRGYARALTVMGNSYWYEGMYEFAQNHYLLAARQYQSIHDSVGLGQTYNNIGEVYKKLNEFQKALEYLLKSSELKRKDSATRAITLYNIGELYIRLNDLEKGRQYIRESFEFATRENNQRVIAFDYWSMAAIRQKENDLSAALEYFFKAEKIWEELGEIRSLIQTYQDIAAIYCDQRNFTQAEQYLTKATALARQIRVPDLQVKNYLRLARLDSLRGNYGRALHYLSRHNILKDSVYNLLKAEQIARLQTIYETENHERENQQLRTERQLKDSQLATQRITLVAISAGLLVAGILAWVLYRQQKKILFQKEAIETQAIALLKLNEELHDLNRTLEARISQRTSQLTLQNKRLSEFTFINAHKLRAPVASILGLINLLDRVSEAEKQVVLEHLKTCGEELDNVIHDVNRELEGAIVKDSEYH